MRMSLNFGSSNFELANKFLTELDDQAERFVFQTYDDKRPKRGWLSKVIDGRFIDRFSLLKDLNIKGASICVMINESKGERTKESVTKIRAIGLDFDNVSLPEFEVPPSIIVKTQKGEHVYWLMNDCDFGRYELLNDLMITKFGSDPSAKGIERVLRIPGFYHQRTENPFMIDLIHTNGRTKYEINYLADKFGLSLNRPKKSFLSTFDPPKKKVIIDDSVVNARYDLDGRFEKCKAYISKVEGAIEGCGGDGHTFAVANLGYDFGLEDSEFWPLLVGWNDRCTPPWDEEDLMEKVDNARKYRKGAFGCKINDVFHAIPEEVKSEFVFDVDEFVYNTKQSQNENKIYQYLDCPGVLGDLSKWISDSSYYPQKVLSLAAALSAMACVLGRKVRTESGLRTNLYMVSVGETSCGKDGARKAITNLFLKLNSIGKIGSTFASDSAVENAVINSPSCLYLIDEIGYYLGTLKDDRAPTCLKSVLPILMNMTGSAQSAYIGKTYSRANENCKDQKVIINPCLSIYGTTVPTNFHSSIRKEDLGSGFLGRFTIFESDNNNPKPVRETKPIDESIPIGIFEWFEYWLKFKTNPENNLEDINPDPIVISETQEAKDYFYQFKSMIWEKKEQKIQNHESPGPYGKLVETAQKFALIRACGSSHSPVIGLDDAKWACDLVELLMDNLISKIGDCHALSDIAKSLEEVLSFIKSSGSKGRTSKEIGQKFKPLFKDGRKKILDNLLDSEEISVSKVDGKKKPTLIYKFVF